MMISSIPTTVLALILGLSTSGSAVTLLATDFTGVNTSDTSAPFEATGIAWTTHGVSAPSSSLVFYDPGSPSTTFGFHAGGSSADNIQVARNIETGGPWATSFTFTTSTAIDLLDFSLDFRAISNSGANQTASKSALYTLRILEGLTSIGSASDSVTDPGGGTALGDVANINLGSLPDLEADTTYTLILTVSSSATSGNNVAIDNLVLRGNPVPEPCSPLLFGAGSLLLIARRRA